MLKSAGMVSGMNMDAAPERVDFMEMAPETTKNSLAKNSKVATDPEDAAEAQVEDGCVKTRPVPGTAAVVADKVAPDSAVPDSATRIYRFRKKPDSRFRPKEHQAEDSAPCAKTGAH